MVRSFATFAGWLEYSSSSLFATWTRYFAVMEGSSLVLYTKEGTAENLTDADKYVSVATHRYLSLVFILFVVTAGNSVERGRSHG